MSPIQILKKYIPTLQPLREGLGKFIEWYKNFYNKT